MNAFARVRFLLSVASVDQFPPDRGIEVAFAGRSNAGKSSALNALMSRNALARTSRTPGRTRLLNYFEVTDDCRVVDLPGYGYADVPAAERRKWLPLVDALRERQSLRALVLIVDCRRGIREEDVALIEWADPAVRRVHVLLSKADKLNQADRAAAVRDARSLVKVSVAPEFQSRIGIQAFSAHDGIGLKEAKGAFVQLLTGLERSKPDQSSSD